MRSSYFVTATRNFHLIEEVLSILWRVSPMRELLKRGASNQARNRKRTSCYAKCATVERVAKPRSLLRNRGKSRSAAVGATQQ
jgi:hypothetical protein